MLRCPFCQHPVTESTESCEHCDFSVSSLSKLLGIPPKIHPHVHDFTGVLNENAIGKLRALLHRNGRTRRGNNFHLVISNDLDPRFPLSVHGFWLLNKGDICTPIASGGECYDVLVLVNPDGQQAALCAGYGIEWLIDQQSLDTVLENHIGPLSAGFYFPAMEGIIDETTRLLDERTRFYNDAFFPLSAGDRVLPIQNDASPSEAGKKAPVSPY